MVMVIQNERIGKLLRYLDEALREATSLSFHPNDCRGTVIITRDAFEHYLQEVGNTYESLPLY